MKTIKLSKGKEAIVDDVDHGWLSQVKWHFNGQYAVRWLYTRGQPKKLVRMHRAIMGTPAEMECDHINGDKLDNRRENLRNCTPSQNCMNRPISSRNKTGVKGVSFRTKKGLYAVQITRNGKTEQRTFKDFEKAKACAEEMIQRLHGEFARKD